jgi:molybdopterin synthase sulfur carrier subunit
MGQVKVLLSSVLTSVTNGEKSVEVSASTLSEALSELAKIYGDDFKERIFDSTGKLRRLLSFYVNGRNVLHISGLETELTDGDEVSIIPTVSGG